MKDRSRYWPRCLVLLCAVLLSVSMLLACTDVGVKAEDAGKVQVIAAEDAHSLMQDEAVVLLDVRSFEEYESGHIEGAILLPVDEINKATTSELIVNDSTPVIVYCRSGVRSATAANTLVELGYQEVYDLGSINSWPYNIVAGSDI